MSRPGSYHDGSQLASSDSFSLPLFNPHQSSGPSIPLSNRSATRHDGSTGHLPPPPPSATHQLHRHSINQQQAPFAPYANGNSHPSHGFPPHSAGGGVVPPPSQYTRPAQYIMGTRHEELMPPPSSSSSGGLGALARSASLGARKKDPYAYSSDDVESGLGQMDMRGERAYAQMHQGQAQGYAQMARPGYNPGGGGQGQGQGYGAVGSGAAGSMDVTMSSSAGSTSGGVGGSRPYSTSGRTGAGMPPPPIPNHHSGQYGRPPPTRNDSSSTSPHNQHHPSYATGQSTNPYVPRTSDPGPSIQIDEQPDWDYPRSHSNDRIPSSASYHSQPSSDLRSPFLTSSDTRVPSPHSPMLNPYDSSPQYPHQNIGSSPSAGQNGQRYSGGSASGAGYPPSPTTSTGMRPPQPPRSQSQQTYPASQPATPAGKYDAGPPPRGARDPRPPSGMKPSPQQGFREVRDWSDLKPIGSEKANGRRADPLRPGKFLSPLQCLTSALPQTYQLCNPQFRYESSDNPRRVLTKPSKAVHNDGVDNEDWDYILYVNDVLGGDHGGDRYLILDVLGQGTFGQVVKCQNMRTHDIWAVKVVKNKPAYLNQSKMEVAILELLNTQYDPHDQHHILRMQESFIHKNHLCLVFECLSSNLYELIKQNQFKGLSTQLVKVFTHQLLECLAVLKDARLIHCDLKPENILLKSLQSPQIKIIDFGSACHEMQTVYTYIQSRFYRSPEVLLGLPYSTSIDMWSLGCIVVELFLGLPLFPGTSEYNQLSRIVDMLGTPPGHLLDVGKQTHEFFNYAGVDAHGRKQYMLKSLEQYSQEHRTKEQPSKQYFKQTKLRDIIMEYPISKKNPRQSEVDKEMAHRRSFIDFVEGLLSLDPIKRWSPQQAAKHPFITGDKFTGPFQPPSVPGKKSYPSGSTSTASSVTPAASPAAKKYGGLQGTPAPSTSSTPTTATRNQRVYSDASAYNPQAAAQQQQQQQQQQHQPYTAPIQPLAQNTSRPAYAPAYDPPPNAGHRARMPSQGQWHPMGPPQGTATYHQPRIPSSSMATSASHGALRPNPPPTMSINTNPPPNSYYPASRNRSNTINQMDVIPPALARLTHMSMPDPSGHRNLTPVLNRGDDPYREWERRQGGGGGQGGQGGGGGGGHSKNSSMHQTSYPQLEYLQEQAELQAMGGSWYGGGGGGGSGGGHQQGHRSRPSGSSGGGMNVPGAYQMQPHIGVSPTSPGMGYHARQPSEYDLPLSSSSSTSAARSYLPTFPPPAATHTSSTASAFDVFDTRDQSGMGMMYAPLQPSQAYAHLASSPYGPAPGQQQGQGQGQQGQHQSRASFSGPFGMTNPFAQGGGGGQQSPRNPRRSQQYNV